MDDSTWDLKKLLGEEMLNAHILQLEKEVISFGEWRTKLKNISENDFAVIVEKYRRLDEHMSRIAAFVHFRVDTKMDSESYRADLSKIRGVLSKVSNRVRFFAHWWKELSDDQAAKLSMTLGVDTYVFAHMRALRKHTLPEEQENIIGLKDTTGRAALNTLYDMIDARMTYGEKQLTREELSAKFSDDDSAVRKQAYKTFFSTRKPERSVFGEIFKTIVLDFENERELRGYKHAISIRNKSNDIPDNVVEAHLEACRDATSLWQRYFALKAKLLGKPLTRYDIYAPLSKLDKEYSFSETVRITLDAFEEFSPKMKELANEIFTAKHVDALPKKQKRGGAYCWGVTPELPPYLLFNHTGKLRDLMTVAHETGHGVHHQLCRELTPLSCGHALPIAETASVFAEMLVSERLLAEEKDAEVRRTLLASKLDDMYATIGRQSFFTFFEIDAHRLLVAGKTTDDLSKKWMENLKDQFGDVAVADDFADEWLAIPHFFHSPFYCYSYSFGNLLTLALYEQYKTQGKEFVPKYEAFLAAGETKSPVDLCASIGVDISKKEFWQQGFKVVERMIDELEKLD